MQRFHTYSAPWRTVSLIVPRGRIRIMSDSNADKNDRMKVVLDSNVFIAVLNASDSRHGEACELIANLTTGRYEIVAPVLYMWETDAYLWHPDRPKTHSQNAGATFRVTAYDVTSGLYARTYSRAMTFIKGADRVFVSLAKDLTAPLVTNDSQILKHASSLGVEAISVSDFIARVTNDA